MYKNISGEIATDVSGRIAVKPLDVAVGVIKDSTGHVLIALRGQNLHQGGLWEFPGGKVEVSESPEQALVRELKEELDIAVNTWSPLITLNHQYPDLTVRLHVFMVESFHGEAKGQQGQVICWVTPDNLGGFAFPAANAPIISAARLPQNYVILDDTDPEQLLPNLKMLLDKGIKLIQARLKNLSAKAVTNFIGTAYPLCKAYQSWLLLNSAVTGAERFEVDGLHLTSEDLLSCDRRPDSKAWVAASCHNLEELLHAQKIGVDFVVLAPVLPTPTHPDAKVLGWDQFAELTAKVNLPVYALGGLTEADLLVARQAGAQGIAGIRAFLGGNQD